MGKPTCYIQQMKNQYGENWIVAMRPEDIQRNSKRIIKDMVKGSIDYEELGYIFLDTKFLENLIISITNELEINTLDYNANKFYQQYCPDTPFIIGSHIYHLERLIVIYMTILNKLNEVKEFGDIGRLADISALLFNDRNHLN